MKKMIVAPFLVMALSACSSSGGLQQVGKDEVGSLIDGSESGFLFVISDKEEEYMPYVEDAVEKSKAEVNYYYTYQPDGEDGETVEKQVFEDDVDVNNDLDKNHLYYLENGKVSDPIRLTSYDEGAELSARIQDFIEIHE